ncbi:hypothetical protein ACOSQ4_003080 [Xanthoceras sorbifolium]
MAEAVSSWDELIRIVLSRGFPVEIVVEILSKLPVKSLLRFKSACKPWCALFGDRKFIEMHLSKGFAFHPKINDYRAVRIVSFVDTQAIEVEVFSLNADCWRQVDAQGVHLFFYDNLSKAFVNGAMHWVQYKDVDDLLHCYLILSFDVCSEKFNKMALPLAYDVGYELSVRQAPKKFRESLALIAYNMLESCDIWFMKDYGVVDSWVKQYSVRH